MRIKNFKFNKDKLFFTSDTHFFHKNIISYCDRPFTSVEEMNETIITNWNNIIPKDGVVFHLGDVSLTGKARNLDSILSNLNGTKFLVIGNHEKDVLRREYIKKHFKGIYDIAEIYVEDEEISYENQHIVMCHYPMMTWNAAHRNSWQLFGHVHGGLSKDPIKHKPSQLDVGIDCNDFKPISYQQVKEKITKQMMNI